MNDDRYRKVALDMIMAGVKAADPTEVIKRNVTVAADTITICDRTFSRKSLDRILLFSVGKASTTMASAFESVLKPDGGLAITKRGTEIDTASLARVPVVAAYHPEPRAINVEATEQILDMVRGIKPGENVLVVLLVSGGGSALFTAPPPDVSVDDPEVGSVLRRARRLDRVQEQDERQRRHRHPRRAEGILKKRGTRETP